MKKVEYVAPEMEVTRFCKEEQVKMDELASHIMATGDDSSAVNVASWKWNFI